MKIIGSASDFYRLRIIAIDTTEGLDLEWRDDVLYRRPPSPALEEQRAYVVEAVTLDEDELAIPLASFDEADEARAWAEEAELGLQQSTKSEFEERYFPQAGG